MIDKEIEKIRYNRFSEKKLQYNNNSSLSNIGSSYLPKYIAKPYIKYEELITKSIHNNKHSKILDLCCGDGVYSFIGAINGANVIGLDYSDKSIQFAKERCKLLKINIDFRVCDVEKLPFEDNSFDIVTCVGSFSYLDHDVLITQIYRVLKCGGEFICLDSYNHNVFYKINRYFHYLRGHRTFSTLRRMPNNILISKIKKQFTSVEIFHFGIFIFLAPLIKFFLGENNTSYLIEKLDIIFFKLKKLSFKIVFKAIK